MEYMCLWCRWQHKRSGRLSSFYCVLRMLNVYIRVVNFFGARLCIHVSHLVLSLDVETQLHTPSCKHTNLTIYIHIYMHTYPHIHLFTHIHIYIHIHTFTYIYTYIYTLYKLLYIYIVIFHICMSLFESTLLSFCKPQSKLDLLTLRQGSRERKNATEQIENMTLARI